MPDPSSRPRAGVVGPNEAGRHFEVGQEAAPSDLAAYLDFAWWVRWDCGVQPHLQRVIARPVVHVSAECVDGAARLLVHGVCSRGFERRLDGAGTTVAVAFRPGGFRPLLGASVAALRDREVGADELFDLDEAGLAGSVLERGEAGRELLFEWVRSAQPDRLDQLAVELAELVERIETDRTLNRVEQVAAISGVTIRTLQRRFEEYVGISPKWVLQRCRLLEVAAAVHSGEPLDWSALAVDLGYADQSHLIRQFTSVIGQTPDSYRRQASPPS